MRLKNILSRLGTIISIIGGILLFIKGFAPDEIGNKKIDFVFTIISNALPEILILLLFGLFIWSYKYIFAFFKSNVRFKNYTIILKTILINAYVLFLLIFLYSFVQNLYYFSRARYYHYANIDRAHKFRLYTSFSNHVNQGSFSDALNTLTKLEDYYSEESYKIAGFKQGLEMRIVNSNQTFSLEKTFLKGNEGFSRNNLNRLLKAYSLTPDENYLKELLVANEHVNKNLEKVLFLVKSYKDTQEIQYLETLTEEYDDFAINGFVWHSKRNKKYKIELLQRMMDNMTYEEIEKLYENYWFVEVLDDLKNWTRNVKIAVQ